MVAITALFNTTPSCPEGSKIDLYYTLANNNVARQPRSEAASGDPPANAHSSAATDQNGYVLNPSRIASTEFQGQRFVFGIVPKRTTTPAATHNDVAIVSPVYRPISQTLIGNSAVTAVAVGGKGYVAYLTGGGGNTLNVEQCELGSWTKASWTNHATILPNSALAAYPVGQTFHVIFQGNDHSLFDLDRRNGSTEIVNAQPKVGTPLAVTVANNKVYLYFVAANHSLQRILKDDNGWGTASAVPDILTVSDVSQVAVISTGGRNHIFYEARDEPGRFQHVRNAL